MEGDDMYQTTQMQNASGLIATNLTEYAGQVTYWRIASDVRLQELSAEWQKAGLDLALLPEPPRPEVALGRAVADQAAKRTLVRPLARRGAWAVVEETVVEGQAPSYRTLVRVVFDKENQNARTICENATQAEYDVLHDKIYRAFIAHQGMLDHGDVSTWLLGLAKAHNAATLRESGGVYFLPRAEVDFWNKVAGALNAGGAGYVFRIPAMKTDEAVAAITEAISKEAEGVAKTMEDELTAEGDAALGKRALKTRQSDVEALIGKLGTYEDLIGKQLAIRSRVEELQAQLTAKLLTEASEAS